MSQIEPAPGLSPASLGGTIAAAVIAATVLTVVAIVVGFLMTVINYFMSSMRIEAAGFFGALFGGWAGTYAARASCDAVLKAYHKRAVFVVLAALVGVGLYFELGMLPLSWERLTPVAQLVTIGFSSWLFFWVGTD